MKRHILLWLLTVCYAITMVAQKNTSPKWLDKVNQAIFTVETTTREGMTKTGTGFFIQENGEAVASYELFRKAEKAVAISASGERMSVLYILGADDMYDVIRFKVAVPKKLVFLPVAKSSPAINVTVYLPPSKEVSNLTQGTISEITKVNSIYDYFQVDMPLPHSQIGFPLISEAGEVFAMTQADASGKGKTFGIPVAYIQSLQTATTDIFNRTYSEIGIRKAWPSAVDDARLLLLLYASQQDEATYLETLNDFISTFPNYAEGYTSRASHYAYSRTALASNENEQMQLLDKAWNDMENAAKLFKNKGEANHYKAMLIMGVVASDNTLSYKNWNMKVADDYIRKAISEADLPSYHKTEADIAFIQQDYEKAYRSYSIVNNSPESSGESFYFAAKSRQLLPDVNVLEIIDLIDSAVTKATPADAAEYLLENIELKSQLGLHEQVINDYDKYLTVTNGNVSDAFYYYREQAKFRTGDLEGALRDIDMAILMDRDNALYFAEKAAVYLRLNEYTKAQENAEKAIQMEPEFAAAYRILGVSLVRQEKKSEACAPLEKAKEFGDQVADRLIKENCSD